MDGEIRFEMKKFIIILFMFSLPVFGGTISSPPPLPELPPQLQHYLTEMYDNFHVLEITTTAPEGNIKGIKGTMIIYNNSGTFELWINDDGNISWQQI